MMRYARGAPLQQRVKGALDGKRILV